MIAMPDRPHSIWTLPDGDKDYPARWRSVKTWCTRHWPAPLPVQSHPMRRARGGQAIWHGRYSEHAIRDENDFARQETRNTAERYCEGRWVSLVRRYRPRSWRSPKGLGASRFPAANAKIDEPRNVARMPLSFTQI
jgi:hypothetical protein